MRIDRLIVRKTKHSNEVIREVKFNNKGLSLIVDNTKDVSEDSGNNVGKTTVLKIIDLCLGAKSVRNIYYDPDTRTENKVIKEFLSDNKVEAELIIANSNNEKISIRRDLFLRGKRYINDTPYSQKEYYQELKKILFNSTEKSPSYRQLISKFIRVSNTSAESMIKFLPGVVSNDVYDSVYSYLFQILGIDLVNKKNDLCTQLVECQKAIAILGKNKNITSLSVLTQKKEIIENELLNYMKKRNELSYIETYKEELEKKRKISSRINDLEEKTQSLDFEISIINDSIEKLSQEKNNINISVLENIYKEAKGYLPKLHKSFEDLVVFHNEMIQNRIDFISKQLITKQEQLFNFSREIESLLEEKKKITVDILDEGLLDELNLLNRKIEDLSVQKGEIIHAIQLLEEQERIKENLSKQIGEIEALIDQGNVDNNMKIFNHIFAEYCYKLYGEKYFLAYDSNWKSKKKFPVEVASFGGSVGTGKKKAVIVAFDLAYMKYAEEMHIIAPQFVIHDRLENTHINQLKTIFEICQNINGQYIIPILRERIDKVDISYIEAAKVLELSSEEKFFRV